MKQYESEINFVQNFSKEIKVESEFSVNGKSFTAKYAGKNDSKQSIYSVTIDGETKKLNITQLKKRLGVSWTAERANSGESAGTTKFVEKSDKELIETARNVTVTMFDALVKVQKACGKYGLSFDDVVAYYKYDNTSIMIDKIFEALKARQNEALAARAERAEKERAERKRAERKRAEKLQNKLKKLMALGLSKDDILAMLG